MCTRSCGLCAHTTGTRGRYAQVKKEKEKERKLKIHLEKTNCFKKANGVFRKEYLKKGI